ncbi:MAG: hypothetical protein EAZ06_06335 [Cytophagales bacterium]|nr:MAG: hypothetical protein EAZ06_06335 [Cytophagales bacterium]
MKGYVAVQKKLLCWIFTLWKKDVEYDIHYQHPQNIKGREMYSTKINFMLFSYKSLLFSTFFWRLLHAVLIFALSNCSQNSGQKYKKDRV